MTFPRPTRLRSTGLAVAVALLAPGLALAAPRPLLASQVQWDQSPTDQDLEQFFPARALDAERGGTAAMVCGINDDGTLTNCAIVSEDPDGVGFGAATIRAAALYRLHMTDAIRAALHKDGVTVTVPINWGAPGR
jgi:protein TonB